MDVANKLGPSLQVGEGLVWEGGNASQQPSRASQPDSQSPSAPGLWQAAAPLSKMMDLLYKQ